MCFSGSGSHSLPVMTTEPEKCVQLGLCFCASGSAGAIPSLCFLESPMSLLFDQGLSRPHTPSPQRACGQESRLRCPTPPELGSLALVLVGLKNEWRYLRMLIWGFIPAHHFILIEMKFTPHKILPRAQHFRLKFIMFNKKI